MSGADEVSSRVKIDAQLNDEAQLRFEECNRCLLGIGEQRTEVIKKAAAFICSPLARAFHDGLAILANPSARFAVA